METSNSTPDSDKLTELRIAYRKRIAKLRRLLRERDAIEAAARNGTDSKPNPRLATLEHELSDTIESRNRLGREIDKLLGSEVSDSDDGGFATTKACDPVRSRTPYISVNSTYAGRLRFAPTADSSFSLPTLASAFSTVAPVADSSRMVDPIFPNVCLHLWTLIASILCTVCFCTLV
jgi:hypothetical protein